MIIKEDRYKFRAWDTINNRMLNFNWDIWFCSEYISLSIKLDARQDTTKKYDIPRQAPRWDKDEDKLVIMQCTWLKDKNWKLIYEWDILDKTNYCNNSVKEHIWEVKMWYVYDSDWYSNCTIYCYIAWNSALSDVNMHCNILWNIYQNPELLNSK